MGLLSEATKAAINQTIASTLVAGAQILDLTKVAGDTGDIEVWTPRAGTPLCRIKPVTATEMPSGMETMQRQLYLACFVQGVDIGKKNRISVGTRTFDVVGLKDEPLGDTLLRYVYVAEVKQ